MKSYRAVVIHPWYDVNGRKYLDLRIDGLIQRVKVPFRYNRVMCLVNGLTPVQLIPENTTIDCVVDDVDGFYVLRSITPRASPDDRPESACPRDP
jgi:hypothetical protein